jgi:hypothetical protein
MLSTYLLNIISVCFTPVPQILYIKATNAGNMAYAGIALGLIRVQNIFWFANFLFCLSLFLKSYVNIFILLTCVLLYILSFSKYNYLVRFLNKA